MLALFFLFLSLAAVAVFVFFAKADGDLTLLSKGPARREAVQGKVVWITGASRGIGRVLATQFASFGAKLILSARSKEDLQMVKNQIISKYPTAEVEVLPLDLSSREEALKKSVGEAESLFSGAGVDFMIHNAAFERPAQRALDDTEEDVETMFRVNALGPILLTRLLAPYMLHRGKGHFVVMSTAKTPSPGLALCLASKHALEGYFHTLRSELCQKGIGVTVLCGGPIQTEKVMGGSEWVPAERCAELIIIAATHGLKEAWISYQPVLIVMYLVQYMPTVGYWLLDKIGANRLDTSEKKGNEYSWNLLFGKKKTT